MVTTQIVLTDEQARALEQVAAAEGHSVSEVIRKRIGALVPFPSPAARDREEVKRRAVAVIGRFRSEVHDLASEHDQYLDEAFED